MTSTRTATEEAFVVGWNSHTNGERTENIEEEDTPEDTANRLGDVPSWVLGFSCCDSYHLHTTVAESSVCESGEEASKAGGIAARIADVATHGSIRLSPVSETKSSLIWSTSKIDDEGENEQADDRHDFDA